MELKIEPSNELTLKVAGKRIGFLEGLYIDTASSSMFGVPKIKLKITVEAKAFDGNKTALDSLISKVQKFKFLEMTLMK
jgi:hypothetical protein